jgi:hypothetical protein
VDLDYDSCAFLVVVVALDLFLVAPVFERSYAMFASVLGTWLPFPLIFAAAYMVGRWASRKASRVGKATF